MTICMVITGARYLGDAGTETAIGVIPKGTGPIFLSALDCRNDEERLLDCSFNSALGINTISCSHNLDVTIHCEGIVQV